MLHPIVRTLIVALTSLLLIGMASSNPKSPCLGKVYPGMYGEMVLDCSDGNPCVMDSCGYYEGSMLGLVCSCENQVTPACCDVYVEQSSNNVTAAGTCGGQNCLGARGESCALTYISGPMTQSHWSGSCSGW